MSENFYHYQDRRFRVLLSWGLSSVGVGALLLLKREEFWKQFALQALTWGAIDAALALFALKSAQRKEEQLKQGRLSRQEEGKDRRNFLRILLVNTLLDVGYVVSGIWIMRHFRQRNDRRGLGAGIAVQGAWLFLFDGFLSGEMSRRWKS